jgi:tetratricopeptide (TPR) repeat protein
LREILEPEPNGMWLYVAIAFLVAFFLLACGAGLYLLVGPGPVRSRAYHRARRALEQGEWRTALASIEALQSARLPPAWQDKLRSLAGEGRQAATDAALKEKQYEEAMEQSLQAASLLGTPEADARARVVDAMLAESRRLFSAGPDANDETLQLLGRVLALQSPCPEARFWQALCFYRRGEVDLALAGLTTAYEQAGKTAIDPAFYLGAVLHKVGRTQEGLRYLGEANRVDAGCPFVTWQMGVSLIASGGDSGLALRALQRALGTRGLPLWSHAPQRAWVEAFPEGRSYVRRLAAKYPYVCPVLGGDLNALILEGQFALAQAHYRQGGFQEAADLFNKLLQNTAPTPALLRAFGLALARLGRYDQAYKPLRTALEQEEPKDPYTAAYLALCGAMAPPRQPEDKPKNVAWAVRLLARYVPAGDAELAGILSTVHAEARALQLPLSAEEETQLCDVLASVAAVDAPSAQAYTHLAVAYPESVKPIHAWLYTHAASVHDLHGERDLDLFARTFRDPAPAREYFAQRQWNFDDAEYTYLKRSAAVSPGRFPEPLGPDYAARGEEFLLTRSRAEEAAGRKDAALECVEVLLRLAPPSLEGHDRLACLHYRNGNMDRAAALLAGWHRLNPVDHWPLIRQAIIEQQRGNAQARADAIDQALGLTRGRQRAAIAFLGARLALQAAFGRNKGADEAKEKNAESAPPNPEALAQAAALLQSCLHEDPNHIEALWKLAAVRSAAGDRPALAAQAAAMDRPSVTDARFHYLGAICYLAARDYAKAVELGQRAAAGDATLTAESHYVMAWAHLHLNNGDAARQSLMKAAAAGTPSATYARALLGQQSFARSAYDEAIRWWNQIDPRRRAEWKLDEPLRQTVLLAGLTAYEKGKYELAAERIREAGRLGLRDRRLGSLLTLALVKAGQRLLFDVNIKGVK